jgi:hypothetical protein
MPGSAHSQAAWVTLLNRVLASTVSITEPSMRARSRTRRRPRPHA